MARHIDLNTTAKMIRAELKRRWPSTRFSVRGSKYSMGSHIHISWTDGPPGREVEAVTSAYSSNRFDGSCDGSYSVQSWLLPDGTVEIATDGADGYNRGTVAERTDGAELVSFSGSAPSCSRELSDDYVALCEKVWPRLSSAERCALLNNYRFPRYSDSEGRNLASFLNADLVIR